MSEHEKGDQTATWVIAAFAIVVIALGAFFSYGSAKLFHHSDLEISASMRVAAADAR